MFSKLLDKVYEHIIDRHLAWEGANGEFYGKLGPVVAEHVPFADVLSITLGPIHAQLASFQYGCWCGHISIFGLNFRAEFGK